MRKRKDLTILDFLRAIVWSYTRVSSKEQFLKNGSIETQVKRLKSFAQKNNLIITKEFDAKHESSKRINTQKTLNELINVIKNTPKAKRPKIILIWSPSRFGRAGAEHIELFVSLRRKYGIYIYSVSSGHNTFTERNENEFSTQLLQAQKENFNRQDVIIPGMINALEKGIFLGRAPRGYDHFGPRVTDPLKVQANQEIKLNKQGLLLKEVFKLKIYHHYTDKEIQDRLLTNGLYIPKQSISVMWSNPFYAGYFTNSLLPNTKIKGNWTPIITNKEYDLLQERLFSSNQLGIAKINGKVNTPLTPRFLICDDCNQKMTSYLNKRKYIYYYKCCKCNKTANANTKSKSLNIGLHDQFSSILCSLKFSKTFHKLFSKQITKIIDFEMNGLSDKKRFLKTEMNELQEQLDAIEFGYLLGKFPEGLYKKHSQKLKTQINEKKKNLDSLPTKMSNQENLIKKFLKIAENPTIFYDSLDYHNKRAFQSIVFPEGFKFSLKNKECRTSKINLIFELTNCFLETYADKKEKTQLHKTLESRLVAGAGLEPATFGL
jgi:site-specific DNA recombinase